MSMQRGNRKIWIVSFYTTPPEYDTHLRHQKFAQYLAGKGYDVTIFTGSFMHGKDIDFIEGKASFQERMYDGKKYVHLRTMRYKDNGLKRMLAIFQFSIRLYFLRNRFEKPDLILHNLHAPFDGLVYCCAKKLKAKYVTEVWDLWPESFVSFGLVKKTNPLLKIAYNIEKRLYVRADRMIFTMEGGSDYIREKGWDGIGKGKIDLNKISYINNGVDCARFEEDKALYRLNDPDLHDADTIKLIYLGSIRLANGLKELMDAAKLLKDHPRIKFLIYGDGLERSELEDYCRKEGMDNVLFKEKWVPLNYVPYILSCAYFNLLIYKQNEIERFGGSSGKLFQYLASGKPICSNQATNYNLINSHQIGTACNFRSDRDFADALLALVELDAVTYEDMCARSGNLAKEFDYKRLTDKLTTVLEAV